MSPAPIASMFDSRIPLRPFLQVVTKNTHDRGMMVNGVHQPNMKPLDLYLDLLDAPLAELHCSSCGRIIDNGEVYGDGSFCGNGRHCLDCIVLPSQPIEAWRITYKMQRRTSKHPDGNVTITIVQTSSVCAEYIDQLHTALGELVLFRLYPPTDQAALRNDYITALTTRRALIISALSGQIEETRESALREELAELEKELNA